MMAHSEMIRTTTGRNHVSRRGCVVDFLISWSGVLKLLQLILEIICVGIVGNYFTYLYFPNFSQIPSYLFFFTIMTTFMIGTFLLYLSCLVSFTAASIIPKTIYEFLYHSTAFGLILCASVTLLLKANEKSEQSVFLQKIFMSEKDNLIIGTAICGIICAALNFVSTIVAFRSYRRG